MIYDIRHVTTYEYGASVSFARCTLRLLPISTSGQNVIFADLEINPTPAQRQERRDFFGNRVTLITLTREHRELIFTLTARIDVAAEAVPAGRPDEDLASVRAAAIASDSLLPLAPSHFLFASRRAPMVSAITDYARESFAPGRAVVDGAIALMHRIRSDFAYDPDATEVSTPIDVAFAQRRGVCQDYAHIMIAGLRGLGIPAGYVSGYIRTYTPPGKKRLQGADATHAWVAVWCGPRIGWIGLDPTNGTAAGNDHIVLATGRDYSDVAPVGGVILSSGDQSVTVEVDVIPIDHVAV